MRAELSTQGLDPEVLLDGTPGSLTPLWGWITERRAELAADPAVDVAVEPRERWPSWARHTVTSMHVPSATMFVLLDGLISVAAALLVGFGDVAAVFVFAGVTLSLLFAGHETTANALS